MNVMVTEADEIHTLMVSSERLKKSQSFDKKYCTVSANKVK